MVGDAHNYGPTPEEIADRERRMRIEATRKAEEERRIAAEREAAGAPFFFFPSPFWAPLYTFLFRMLS